MTVTLCVSVSVASDHVLEPSVTVLSESSLVSQVIVAEVSVMFTT